MKILAGLLRTFFALDNKFNIEVKYAVENRLFNIKQQKISGDNVYQFLSA